MEKKDIKVAIIAILAVVLIVGLVALIRHQAEGSAHQKMINEKIALVEAHAPSKEWRCISADGGWIPEHAQYEYTFTFMIRGNSNHAIFVYLDQDDLTEETVGRLQRIEDDGFELTPRYD